MNDPVPTISYDDYPYPSLSYALTHPERFATVASLFGLEPVNVERCRVLDIGCAVGGNLIPMAATLPESEFTGIDYSGRQIEIGNKRVNELGLKNVTLEHMDIMDVPQDFGQFDYIIAHGIYSWVPENVRDHLLAIIRQNLAPNGIAYVSYNCYPGWYMLEMARDMMLYRIRDISDPTEKVAIAKDLIDMMAQADYEDNKAYGAFLETYQRLLGKKLSKMSTGGDSLVLHDELSEVNDPVYFHQFAKHAAGHSLQYLSEVDLFQISPSRYPKDVVQALGQMAKNTIDFEQYIDFLQNRTFRKSLVCHQEATITRRLRPESVYDFYISSYAEAVSKTPDLKGASIEQFKGKDGALFSTDHPLSKAALDYVSAKSPMLFSFKELLEKAAPKVGVKGEKNLAKEKKILAANILRAYSYSESLVQVHVYRPTFVTHVSERPLATPVARWQAENFGMATSMRHERIEMDPLGRQIFMHLDGQHNREDIHQKLLKLFEEGTMVLSAGQEDLDASSLAKLITKDIDDNLKFYAWASLLVG